MYRKKLLIAMLSLAVFTSMISSGSMSAYASTYDYTIDEITSKDVYTTLKETNSSTEALDELNKYSTSGSNYVVRAKNSKSPNRVIATNKGIAQSYPYRDATGSGHAEVKGNTVNIYQGHNKSGIRTYIEAHHQLQYFKTVEYNGGFVAEIEISGYRGFIDVDKIDIIPMIYVEKGWDIELGGNEDYYANPESSYRIVPVMDSYNVAYNPSYDVNEITFTYQKTNPKLSQKSSVVLGIAPDWLPLGKYYSSDGITFYKDIYKKNPVMNGKAPGENYSYFQFLPMRSESKYTAEEYDAWLKKSGYAGSVMHGHGKAFVDNGKKYGMNSLLVYSMAGLESGYGTSRYAKERFNLFGWNAVDSNPDEATRYEGVNIAVTQHMSENLVGYTNVNSWKFGNYSVGNKGAGFNGMYASDPHWGLKIGSLAYRFDRAHGFKELNSYKLSQLTNNEAHVFTNASGSQLYKTKSGLKNQIIVNLGEASSKVKTIAMDSTDSNAHFSYINSAKVRDLGSVNVPDDGFTVESKVKKYTVNTPLGLRLRAMPTTSSTQLSLVPNKTIVEGRDTSNGWFMTEYKGITGYVSREFLTPYTEPKPDPIPPVEEKPPVDEKPPVTPPVTPPIVPDYKLGDVDNSGVIDTMDYVLVRRHILNLGKLNDKQIKAADIDKNGKIDTMDYAKIRRHILNIELIK